MFSAAAGCSASPADEVADATAISPPASFELYVTAAAAAQHWDVDDLATATGGEAWREADERPAAAIFAASSDGSMTAAAVFYFYPPPRHNRNNNHRRHRHCLSFLIAL